MRKLINIFKEFRFELGLIYLFMILTELASLSQPLLLGMSIDGLLHNNTTPLLFLGVSYLLSNFFLYKRMVWDTKVYTKIYNSIVLNFLQKSDAPTSKKVARTDMAHQIIHVLEEYVHYYISTIIGLVGSIIFIWTKSILVGALITLSAPLIGLAVWVFYKKIRQAIHLRNDHYETKVEAIEGGFLSSKSFFKRRRRLEIFESNLQGKNWLAVGLIKNTFLFISIILLIKTTQVTPGSIVTVYTYINNFLGSLLSVPVAVEMYSRITNILERFD
jgi:ABC-type multidrug transport system fused ATPase/permease subunit